MDKIQEWQLRQRQGLPLNVKIRLSKNRIKGFYKHHNGKVYVSFSGDNRSIALSHLVRSTHPDVPEVFIGARLPGLKQKGSFKQTTQKYEKKSKRKPFISSLATDSKKIKLLYLKTGCNSFGKKPISRPLSFWTEHDIRNYIRLNKIPYTSISGTNPKKPRAGESLKLAITYLSRQGIRLSKSSNLKFKDFNTDSKSIFAPLLSPDYPFIKKKYRSLYQKFLYACLRLIRKSNTNLIHAQSVSDALFFLPLKYRTNLPYLVSLRDNDLYANRDKNKKYINTLFRAADLFLVRSNLTKEQLIKEGCDKTKILMHSSGKDLGKAYNDLIKKYQLKLNQSHKEGLKRLTSVLNVKKGEKPKYFRADLHLIQGCNSKCIMCDLWKNKVKTTYTKGRITKLLDELKKTGVTEVRFHGNEPTLRKDLVDIIAEAKKLGFKIGIKTNCLSLNKNYCNKLCNAGLDALYVSIDSPKRATHDKIRGTKGSFERIIDAINYVKEFSNSSIKVVSNTTVMNKNFKDLDDMISLANKCKIDTVGFTHLTCRNRGHISDVSLNYPQMKEFFFAVVPKILRKSIKLNVDVDFSPFFVELIGKPKEKALYELVKNSNKFEQELRNFSKGLYGKKFYEKYGCYGPLDHMTIDTEGNVFSCCVMPREKNLAMGNIHKNAFQEIWNSEKYQNFKANAGYNCKFFSTCGTNFKTRVMIAKRIGHKEDRDFFNKLAYFNHLKNLYHQESSHLKRLQWKKLKRIIKYAYENIPFYNQKFKKAKIKPSDIRSPKDLLKIPLTTKEEIRKNFPDNLVSKRIPKDKIRIQQTSGSASETVHFATHNDHKEFVRIMYSFSMISDFGLGDKYAKFTTFHCSGDRCSHEEELIANLDPKDPQIIIPSSKNIIGDSDDMMRKRIKLLEKHKPKIIHADPVYLRCLAVFMKKNRIKLPFVEAISSTYELLTDSNKKFLEGTFNCKVYDEYGCSEVGPIANSCAKGNKHIYSDKAFVEVIKDGKPVNNGEQGEIVVTDLDNFVMPFIRYETGDIGIKSSKKCTCGRNSEILGPVQGRTKDTISLGDNHFTPRDIDKVFQPVSNILFYQVIQKSKNHITIRLVKDVNFKKEQIKDLVSSFKKNLKTNTQPEIKFVKKILPEKSGKFAFVKSDLKDVKAKQK